MTIPQTLIDARLLARSRASQFFMDFKQSD
jgi:hypothetical protein